MVTEFRQGFRTLTKSAGFSALVIAVLAVGIGANTAIFSIVNGVLLKPLPFAAADRLVALDTTTKGITDDSAFPDFADWRAQSTAFEGMAAYATAAVTITGTGDAFSIPSAVVTSDLFPMLGLAPALGRTFTPEDDRKGAPRTIILSSKLWSDRFARDASIAGRSITVDGEPFTVVGVMPAGFEFPFDTDETPQVWVPIPASRFAAQWANQRGAAFLKVLGKLKPGATVASAQAELSTIAGRLAGQYVESRSRGVLVRPFREVLVKDYRLALVVLLAAVAAVLLIACANIANLLLARGSVRRREIAVRTALGASRGQIVRQLLAESTVLAIAGGAVGALLSIWIVEFLVRMSPMQIPRLRDVHVDLGALAFAMGISVATGILSGLVPAFQLSRSNPGDALKDGERGGSGARGARTRQTLVIAEMALSLVLLASAGLLVRSLVLLQHVNPGFVADRTVSMQLLLPGARYSNGKSIREFYRRLRDEVRALPAGSRGAVTTTLPMTGSNIDAGFAIEGQPVDPSVRQGAPLFSIGPEYFSVMGIPLVKGRAFTDRDDDTAPNVVIVNETMAAKYWPGQDPIGKRLSVSYNNTGLREVVGVVGDVKQGALSDSARPQMYTPFLQTPWPFVTAVVRTTSSPESAAGALRSVLARIDPEQAAGDIKSMDQYIARTVAAPRFTAVLVGSFAALALLLAGFGLFSVTAYAVAQRRREIGIRLALGAQPSDVKQLVVSQALTMSAAGVGIGLAGTLAATRILTSLLFGVEPTDPFTLVAVCATLVAVMLLAAYIPARRATRVDPLTALRTE